MAALDTNVLVRWLTNDEGYPPDAATVQRAMRSM